MLIVSIALQPIDRHTLLICVHPVTQPPSQISMSRLWKYCTCSICHSYVSNFNAFISTEILKEATVLAKHMPQCWIQYFGYLYTLVSKPILILVKLCFTSLPHSQKILRKKNEKLEGSILILFYHLIRTESINSIMTVLNTSVINGLRYYHYRQFLCNVISSGTHYIWGEIKYFFERS